MGGSRPHAVWNSVTVRPRGIFQLPPSFPSQFRPGPGGRARGRGTFEGVASIGIAFGPSSPGAIILAAPAQGQRFDATGFRSPQRLEWPLSWEAAMALVQGRRGGLLACAFEPFRRFKNLELTPEDTGWTAVLESTSSIFSHMWNKQWEGEYELVELRGVKGVTLMTIHLT